MKRGRAHWHDQLGPAMRRRMLEGIDAPGSAKAVYDRLNLDRYCALATFRRFAAARRHAQAARQQATDGIAGERPETVAGLRSRTAGLDLEEIEVELLKNVQAHLAAGTLKPYLLAETRLFLKELERRKQARPGRSRGNRKGSRLWRAGESTCRRGCSR
jgi:hypothetical protein